MALVSIDLIIPQTLKFLDLAPIGGGVELMSYKRNRTIAIIRNEKDDLIILENGYTICSENIPFKSLPKDLKKRIKREFPRSRKVRLVKFTNATELERVHQKI
ncbi:MAG: hypothetical protein OCC45_12975 [Desulfotalea sp.]